MAKRKKRRAPKRRRVAKPNVDEEALDDELDEDLAPDDGAPDEDEEASELSADLEAKRGDEGREAPAEKRPVSAPSSGAPARGQRYQTHEAPANAGLIVMGIVLGLIGLAIAVAAFVD